MQLAIQEPYMLTIQPDDFFISPRRLDENFGTMICFHRRYDLGDEHNYPTFTAKKLARPMTRWWCWMIPGISMSISSWSFRISCRGKGTGDLSRQTRAILRSISVI